MRLHLIRHPRPAVASGICYGRSDLGLAEDAAAVAAQLRPHLPATLAVFSSPLQRCRLLAEHLHPAPRYDERLLEMHFGDWEMQPWQAIDRHALDQWAANPLHFAPPGGESPQQMVDRVRDFVDFLRASGVPEAVLVCHAGILKVLCGLGRGLPVADWMQLDFAYGSLTVLDVV